MHLVLFGFIIVIIGVWLWYEHRQGVNRDKIREEERRNVIEVEEELERLGLREEVVGVREKIADKKSKIIERENKLHD